VIAFDDDTVSDYFNFLHGAGPSQRPACLLYHFPRLARCKLTTLEHSVAA